MFAFLLPRVPRPSLEWRRRSPLLVSFVYLALRRTIELILLCARSGRKGRRLKFYGLQNNLLNPIE